MVSERMWTELCDRSELQTNFSHLVLDGIDNDVFRIHNLHFGCVRCGHIVESVFVCRISSPGMLQIVSLKNEYKIYCIYLLQGIVKYVVLLMHAAEIHIGIQFLHGVYKSNPIQTSANYSTLMRWGKIAYIVMRVSACIILASCVAFVPMNIVENFISDKRLPLLQTFVFGINEQTDIGYVLLYIYHLCMLFLAGVGTCSVDLLLIMFVIHMCPLVELYHNMFEVLNEAVKDPVGRESKQMIAFFNNIIIMHSEICE